MKDITKEQWRQEVIDSNKPVFVDFWTTWCPPCKTISPIIDELEKEFKEKVYFFKIDVDQNRELVSKYNIISVPTLAIFDKGEMIDYQVGAASKESIKSYINKYIS